MREIRRKLDHFFVVSKKGYDDVSWILYVVAGGSIVTNYFGVAGVGATLLAFLLLYFFGRLSLRRERRLKREEEERKGRLAKNRSKAQKG